jgi:HlyD family type I secretion membrane fusion protein
MTDIARPSTDYRRAAYVGIAVIIATFGILGLWAAFSPLSSAVMGHGVVTTSTNRQTVQHYEGGIIRSILVHEGDHVRAGQLLFQLDSVQANASVDIAKNQLFSLLARADRLMAERDHRASVIFSPEVRAQGGDPIVAQAITDQLQQFIGRRASLEGQEAVLRSRISQYETQIEGISEQRAAMDQQVGFLDDEISGLTQLYKQELVPKPRLLALQRERAQLKGQIGASTAQKAQAQKAIGETQLQIAQLRQQFDQDVAKETTEVQTQIGDLRQRYTVVTDQAKRINITAPTSGTIQNLRFVTAGAVVRASESLVDIAPDQGQMEIRAQFSPSDVDSVHTGQMVQLRFSTFHARNIPVIEGVVGNISQDRLVDEATRMPYYLAIVPLQGVKLPELIRGGLKAGMPVDVVVPTGSRTALQYMFDPLSNAMQKAMRER